MEDEIQSWRSMGVDVVVSALDSDEIHDLELTQEGEFCRAKGMEYLAFPIPDRGTPSSAATEDLVHRLEARLIQGKGVLIHCRQGVGRSSMMAASLLATAGVAPEAAFSRIEVARGCAVPDTVVQREWVERFAHELLIAPLSGDSN